VGYDWARVFLPEWVIVCTCTSDVKLERYENKNEDADEEGTK